MEFIPFPKIARLSRDVVVTEKIDGTNAQVCIVPKSPNPVLVEPPYTSYNDDFYIMTGSRTRWITPKEDNYGFARWVMDNASDLLKLGVGSHFGEWWGQGIQRNYSQTRKRFSLFNVTRWGDPASRPACCDVVPTLYKGPLEDRGVMKGVNAAMLALKNIGSAAAPGFMKPEGIVVYHPQGNMLLKKTFEKDEAGKEGGA